MIEDAQREDFRNKMSSIAFMVKTNGFDLPEGLKGDIQTFNTATNQKSCMESLLEVFWKKEKPERTAILENLFEIEDGLQKKQNEAADSFDFFGD